MSSRSPQMKNQICLVPELLEERVEKTTHAARFFVYLADKLELNLYKRADLGTPRYARHTLIAVIFYSMFKGFFGAKEIIKFAEDSIGIAWIMNGMKMPSYKTVERTINTLMDEIDNLFTQILDICEELSLIGKKRMYTDGTKIKANASKHKAMSYGYLTKKIEKSKNDVKSLFAEIKSLAECLEDLSDDEIKEIISNESEKVHNILKKHHQNQLATREEEIFNIDQTINEETKQIDYNLLNKESEILSNTDEESYQKALEALNDIAFVTKRLDKMEAAKIELEEKWKEENGYKKIPDKKQINFTDSDSCIMVTKHQGVQQCYNHFALVDDRANIIMGTYTSNNSSDQLGLIPCIENTEKLYGCLNGFQLGGDAGFFSASNFKYTIAKGLDFYASFPECKSDYAKEKFKYDYYTDTYTCPEGKTLSMYKKSEDENIRQYCNENACTQCKKQNKCTKSKDCVRRIERDMENDEIREKAKEKTKTQIGKEILRLRKSIPEPVWGNIKIQDNFTQMHYRGIDNAEIEFRLHSIIHNIRKIFKVYKKSKSYQQIVHSSKTLELQSA